MAVTTNNDALATSSAEQLVPPKKTPTRKRNKSQRAKRSRVEAAGPVEAQAQRNIKQVDVADVSSAGSAAGNAIDSAKTESSAKTTSKPKGGNRAPRKRVKKTRRSAGSAAARGVDATTNAGSALDDNIAARQKMASTAGEESQSQRGPSRQNAA